MLPCAPSPWVLAAIGGALAAPALLGEGEVEEALAALVEQANDLDSFRAVYRLELVGLEDETPEDGPQQLFLFYEAPDRLRLDMLSQDERASLWVLGQTVFMRTWTDTDMTQHGSVERAPSSELRELGDAMSAALPELFDEAPLEREPMVRLDWSVGEEGAAAEISFALVTRRRCVLGWIDLLSHPDLDLSLGEERIEFEQEDHSQGAVSRATGFLERLQVRGAEEELQLELQELELDVDLESALEPPAAGPGSQDVSAELDRSFPAVDVRSTRSLLTGRTGAALRDGELAWLDVREGYVDALRALHARVGAEREELLLPPIEGRIEDVLRQVRQALQDGIEPVRVRERAAAIRTDLSASLDRTQQSSLESLERTFPWREESAAWAEEMLALEIEVADEIFERVVRRPLLESYDEGLRTIFEEIGPR